MSLRRQSLSPTANLLRNSRLFSLPNPLPRPSVADRSGSGNVRSSESATTPYPTHQAIITTPSSLARGDWGLKRPLPARSRILQTSDPVLKVRQWDTIEQITDFESAADHVRTKQKFEEMSVPMVARASIDDYGSANANPKSAFETAADLTSYETGLDGAALYVKALEEKAQASSTETGPYRPAAISEIQTRLPNLRWKHEGPLVSSMRAADFFDYLSTKVSTRRADFNQIMVQYVKNDIYKKRRSKASKSADAIPLDPAEADAYVAEQEKAWSHFTPTEISSGIADLRAKCAADPLNSDLVNKLIVPFLRLPPLKVKAIDYASDDSGGYEKNRFSAETMPNTTHPSAGLGYLRTRSYIANHPILGPQADPSPIIARVLQPRKTGTVHERYARLGVAGFVADDEYSDPGTRQVRDAARDVEDLDLKTPGGKKLQVQPSFASVDSEGRVHLKLKRSSFAAVNVKKGQLMDQAPERENVESNPVADLKLGSSGTELDGKGGAGEDELRKNFFETLSQGQAKGQKRAGAGWDAGLGSAFGLGVPNSGDKFPS